MIALLMFAQIASTAAAMHAQVARAPGPVRAFIERRAGCNHFAGEEAYDRDRGRDIERALRALRCGRLEADERVLRARWRQRPDLLRLLTATADALGW